MMNPAKLLTIKKDWDGFSARHPRFVQFIMVLMRSGIGPGAVIDVTVTLPDGNNMQSNIKLTQEDVEFFGKIKDMM